MAILNLRILALTAIILTSFVPFSEARAPSYEQEKNLTDCLSDDGELRADRGVIALLCYRAGVAFRTGADESGADHHEINLSLARNAFQRGCDLSGARSCENLGEMYTNGEGGAVDVVGARKAFEKGCREDFRGCIEWADMAREGEGGSADLEEAYSAYTSACSAFSARGCAEQSYLGFQGYGREDEIGKYDRLHTTLANICNQSEDDSFSCHLLGLSLRDAPEEFRDLKTSTIALATACNRGAVGGCLDYAHNITNGVGVPANPELAEQILKAICDAGHQSGCDAKTEITQ